MVETLVEPQVTLISSTIGKNSNWIRRYSVITHSMVIENTFIGFSCDINWSSIGRCTQIGSKSQLLGSSSKQIVVGNYCWIGSGVTVESGIKIGEGAVVGAGSYIDTDVSPYTVVAGQPARFIRERLLVRDSEPDFSAFLNYVKKRDKVESGSRVGDISYLGTGTYINADLKLGLNVHIGENCILLGRKSTENTGGIKIGNHVLIGDKCILEGAGGIELGDSVVIEDQALLLTTSHNYKLLSLPQISSSLCIESNVTIGKNSIILGGLTIGNRAIIYPNSVVTRNVPSGAIVSGIPARKIIKDTVRI